MEVYLFLHPIPARRCPEEIWLSSVESRLVDVADGKPTLTLPQFKDIMQVKEV